MNVTGRMKWLQQVVEMTASQIREMATNHAVSTRSNASSLSVVANRYQHAVQYGLRKKSVGMYGMKNGAASSYGDAVTALAVSCYCCVEQVTSRARRRADAVGHWQMLSERREVAAGVTTASTVTEGAAMRHDTRMLAVIGDSSETCALPRDEEACIPWRGDVVSNAAREC